MIVHIQHLIIITKLDIQWPPSIIKFQSSIGSITASMGSMSFDSVCLSVAGVSPQGQAAVHAAWGLAYPLGVICLALVLWAVR